MTLDDYKDEIRRLKYRLEEKDREISRLALELDSAEFKIRHELEPRIQAERRAYDRWAANPKRGDR